MTRIIKLTESDLSRIIDKVLNESPKKRGILSEQKLNANGTYTVKNQHSFQMVWVNDDVSDASITITVPENTIVKKGSDGKSVEFDIYAYYWSEKNKSGEDMYVGKGKINCGELVVKLKDNGEYFLYNGLFFKYDDPTNTFYSKYGDVEIDPSHNDITYLHYDIEANGGVKNIFYTQTEPRDDNSFAVTMNKLFCDGSKLKSVQKPATQSKCKFVEKEFSNEQVCFIPDDKEWMYAKTDDGKWYTTKQSDRNKWCELDPVKFKSAIDKLKTECGLSLKPIPKIELKPIN
jgi:hypothetical protein